MLNNRAITTVFMSTDRGDFAWMEIDLLTTVRLSDAASAVLRYGFKSICVDDFGASQFPMLGKVACTVQVDGSSFWLEAVDEGTQDRDRTTRVLIRDIRQAAYWRTPVILSIDGREAAFRDFVRSMRQHEREAAFGSAVAERLVSEFQPLLAEKLHG